MSYDTKSEHTKNALADSLKELMMKKAFNKISIREITENCGYKRLTFYYHFDDIYDLLRWTIRRELVVPLQKDNSVYTWQEVALYILHYLQSNELLALSVLDSVGRETLRKLLANDTERVCMYFLREIGSDLDVSDEAYRAVNRFYCVTLSANIADWLEDGMQETPEELVRTLETIISGTARRALERFAAIK